MRPDALRSSAIAALLASSLVSAAPAGATTARVLALGGQGDYLEDQSNVLTWYGSLVDYPDLFALELGEYEPHDAAQGAGLHWRLDEDGRWGTIAAYLRGEPDREGRDSTVLMWGRAFGPVAAALALSGSDYAEQRGSAYDADVRRQLGAGIRWEAAPRLYADLAAELLSTEFSHLRPGDSLFVDPGVTHDGFAARVRVFWGPNERVALVPVYEHTEDDRAAYERDLPGPADLDLRINRWGIGLNILPDPDRLLVLSIEYEDGERGILGLDAPRAGYDMIRTRWERQALRLGFEVRALSFLTVRGAARYLYSEDDVLRHQLAREEPPQAAGFYYEMLADEEVAADFGLALHLGRFEADFVFNDRALNNLGGLLTNSDSYGAQFTRVSLLYSF